MHFILLSSTHVQLKVVTKIFGLMQTELKNFLCTGRRIRSATSNREEAATKPFEIFLSNFSTIEKNVPRGMVILAMLQGVQLFI